MPTTSRLQILSKNQAPCCSPKNKLRQLSLTAAAAALLCLSAPAPVQAKMNAQDECLCQALMNDLQLEKELRFIRNGERYNSTEAANHLRRKFDYAKDRLNSVTDFIDKLASASWFSGEPYMVVLPGGRQLKARDYLISRLEVVKEKCPAGGTEQSRN